MWRPVTAVFLLLAFMTGARPLPLCQGVGPAASAHYSTPSHPDGCAQAMSPAQCPSGTCPAVLESESMPTDDLGASAAEGMIVVPPSHTPPAPEPPPPQA